MKKEYDVVIVGAGIAGLYGALNLSPGLRVLLVCKEELILSNSALAQGGIAAVIDTENDSADAHFNDTLIAGGFKNNPNAVRILVDQGPKEVRALIEQYGAEFDHENGSLHFTLEGGHSKPRIVHYKDYTGRAVSETLIEAVKKRKNVELLEHAVVCGMAKGKGFSFDILSGDEHFLVSSHYCILATGGIGRVYEYTTNSKIATGDGIALAYQLGAKIKNLHLVQFHPTGFANHLTRETFLISESVRGEGAYLLNCRRERFMHKYDERLELAPRDVVSHAIMEEQKATGSKEFYLDITHKPANFVRERFPMIYSRVLEQGFDMTKEPIPIYPCQHYLMGGIDVDLNGKSSVDRLYAAGECSHTGVHGNNRLASNSLLEALVFSHRAADEINRLAQEEQISPVPAEFPEIQNALPLPAGIRTETRAIMQRAYFITPNQQEIVNGYERVCALKKQLETTPYRIDRDYVEAKSLVTVAYIILKELL
ncbi:L-aspartate oxidase [Massiliimalia timonensis]|uniref:L-aspartate oxidase n=1 Tax=Massiliimalia timonensis TaxID=1987501 RepID=UPI00193A15AD|nr:FAD-dependent oxidoreductase [Massiliimalia timonensis]